MSRSLNVSPNRRFLTLPDGAPFFYLADTAWELFHRPTLADAELYLRDRAAKRFTAIQAVALAEYDGLTQPNANGDLPFEELDVTRPGEAYWRHVDAVVALANDLGLWLALLPTWGDKWNKQWGIGPEIFTLERAAIYGEWIGARYRAAKIIWMLGGDRAVDTAAQAAIIRAMAAGVRRGDGGRHLMTFHTQGQRSSAEFFHDDDWLDFNTLQSGHTRDRDSYRSVAEDYARSPVKPCMDAEPGYEDHPIGFDLANGYLDADDVRKFAYWGLLAGGFGHTYGCHDIWQFLDPARNPPITHARTPWHAALDLPGAGQMAHVRALFELRQDRAPDQSLVQNDAGEGGAHIAAALADDRSYAIVYIPDGRPTTIDLLRLGGERVAAEWRDPRSGERREIGVFERTMLQPFVPPSAGHGQDWALLLTIDD